MSSSSSTYEGGYLNMRKRMLMRAASMLVGAGLAATVAPAAVAAPAAQHLRVPAAARSFHHQTSRTAKTATPNVGNNGGVLNPGDKLLPGQKIVDNDATLEMQGDGNLVIYLNYASGQHFAAVWQTRTWGNAGAYLIMQGDGNLVLYKAGGTGALWSSGTWGKANANAEFYTGDLMVGSDSTQTVFWDSGTGYLAQKDANGNYPDVPSDSLLSGEALWPGNWIESTNAWVLMQTDGNLVVYRKRDGKALWSSNTWNKTNVVTVMDSKGVLAVIDKSNGNPYWDSNTWNSPGAHAQIQGDLNFVVRTPSGTPVWSSGTYNQY
ncbi:hypothetical protein LN042_22440 [Kitasatospora sp. RB6PN24]|uniref:hypothetical protein n=1 Tax=Kitasatospora humi TaxID=2893891 RepID=UPI001E445D39|nr:hypothetical protein [Kitasatospora humi]MCC9309797.1 hypothetical protein [Kitasatospora humi]